MLCNVLKNSKATNVAKTLASLMLLFVLTPYQYVTAGSVWLPDGGSGLRMDINSQRERKFETIIKQQYDFSCGSAALATLLTFHYEEPTSEQSAFSSMYEQGDVEKIQKLGFSLLDMKGYLETRGYQADGYKASLDTLAGAGVPAIALVNVQGYKHFVVVKGVDDKEVLIGDPALGLRFMPRQRFESMWENQILFIIRNRSETAQNNFNAESEWRLLARAPLGEAVSRETLEEFTISLPQLNDY